MSDTDHKHERATETQSFTTTTHSRLIGTLEEAPVRTELKDGTYSHRFMIRDANNALHAVETQQGPGTSKITPDLTPGTTIDLSGNWEVRRTKNGNKSVEIPVFSPNSVSTRNYDDSISSQIEKGLDKTLIRLGTSRVLIADSPEIDTRSPSFDPVISYERMMKNRAKAAMSEHDRVSDPHNAENNHHEEDLKKQNSESNQKKDNDFEKKSKPEENSTVKDHSSKKDLRPPTYMTGTILTRPEQDHENPDIWSMVINQDHLPGKAATVIFNMKHVEAQDFEKTAILNSKPDENIALLGHWYKNKSGFIFQPTKIQTDSSIQEWSKHSSKPMEDLNNTPGTEKHSAEKGGIINRDGQPNKTSNHHRRARNRSSGHDMD